jgi:hypothetical protein
VPIVGLTALALATFWFLYAVDHAVTGGAGSHTSPDGLFRYFFFDSVAITDAVSALGGLVAGVLGIVISVVSIVVQLSAERYTGVTAMFFRDRTNKIVLGFYVVTCVIGVWVGLSVRGEYVPRVTVAAMVGATTIALVLMAPYFAHVFRFLEPASIIDRIVTSALRTARQGTLGRADVADTQRETIVAMEELTDITSNSISGKDKIIASRAVDALRDLAVRYIALKKDAAPAWFSIGPRIQESPDFVAMDPESLADLEVRRTWVEWKVMRQYLGIYNEALGSMRDINYLIAIDTRYIGEAAARAGDRELYELVLRFMNSYMRATLNAREVRTAYNVLNQYRLFVESLLDAGLGTAALAAVGHLKYYGSTSFDMKLPFVTETAAYDVGALCQMAHDRKLPEHGAMLRLFLDLDRPATSERSQELGLKGVRKAQVKLAAYYLLVGDEVNARLIHADLAAEPPERLRAIRDELERVETKDFWEIIDRGRNFEYMPKPQKEAMGRFFGWFAASP